MSKLVAFLRAINVGGRRVSNDQLVSLVTDSGFTAVSAYQAAGNLLLDPGGAPPAVVASRIEQALEAGLGYRSEVFIRDAPSLSALLELEPFADIDHESAAKPQIAFLLVPPEPAEVDRIAALAGPSDHLAVHGREVHWLPLAGVGRSALDLGALARIAGPLTVRTRGTVARILPKLTG